MQKPIEPYKCTFFTSNEIIHRISTISFKLGRLSLTNERKVTTQDSVLATKSTLALEGIEVKPAAMRALRRGATLETAVLPNKVFDFYQKIHRINPYDKGFLAKFEEVIWPDGVPHRLSRRVPSYPYGIPMHAKIEPLMNGMYKYIGENKDVLHPLIIGGLFYFEIMAIEPYSELNGVLARLLLKSFLGTYSPSLYCLPLEKMMINRREDLEKGIALSTECGDTAPFISALLQAVEDGIDALLRESVKSSGPTSDQVKKLLSLMEEGKYYSANELLALLTLKSRVGLQRNYLKPALQAKLIEMSNPVTKTDRGQKYRKK